MAKFMAQFAGLLALAAGNAASAADLPVKAPPSQSQDLWTGAYVGAHVGYALGNSDWTAFDTGSGAPVASGLLDFYRKFGGLFGGLQLGYNYQISPHWVAGMEADITFPNRLDPSRTISTTPGSQSAYADKAQMFGTVRGRIGYTFDQSLVYATGGFAWSYDQFNLTQLIGTSANGSAVPGTDENHFATRTGWALGAGVETALAPHWSARLEYLFMDFANHNVTFPIAAQRFDSDLTLQTIRLGLNYKFDDFQSGSGSATALGQIPNQDTGIWNIHGQTTLIEQGYPAFHSSIPDGTNSLSSASQARNTVSATAFAGIRLWDGAELYFDPEINQGFGLSGTFGLAGFPNGEAQKAGFPTPHYNTARLFLRQTFGLGGEQETLEDGQNQLAGKVDVSRVTVNTGKMSVPDFFDHNTYADDNRNGFMNWAIWNGGAFDYAADQLGYDWGSVIELNQKDWALRAGYFLVPSVSNSNDYDTQLFRRGQYLVELEERYSLFAQPGKLRLTAWASSAFAGSYAQTLADPALNLDITQTRQTRLEYGYIANIEQAINDDFGVFSRLSWNNGQSEIIAFTDIDRSFSLGGVLKGTGWGRPDDKIGVAGVINGLSDEHRAFFAAGGLGILIGDGELNYRPEKILETYYSIGLNKWSALTFDYQFVADPAYNADRGPVSIFAARFHAEF